MKRLLYLPLFLGALILYIWDTMRYGITEADENEDDLNN